MPCRRSKRAQLSRWLHTAHLAEQLAHGRGFTLQLGLLRSVADVRSGLHRRWAGWGGAVPSVLRAQLQGCKATARRVAVLLVAEGRSGSSLVGVCPTFMRPDGTRPAD